MRMVDAPAAAEILMILLDFVFEVLGVGVTVLFESVVVDARLGIGATIEYGTKK